MNTTDLLMQVQPRHLDAAPKKVGLKKAPQIMQFGCQAEFIIAYDENKKSCDPDAVCWLEIPNGRRIVDNSIYYALLTLVKSSVCGDPQRAKAYFNIFMLIAETPGDTLTEARLFETISKYASRGVYENELVKALLRCVYNKPEVVTEWLDLADYFNPYPNTMAKAMQLVEQNCYSIKDVYTYIKKLGDQMKQDKAFKKATMNKFMAPVVWACLST